MKILILLLVSISSTQVRSSESVEVTVIGEGETAIYSGLLVREGRFARMLEAELAVKELEARLEIQKNLTASLESVYTRRMTEMARPLPWYKTPSFNRWAGFAMGVAFTAVVVYAGSYLVRAVD